MKNSKNGYILLENLLSLTIIALVITGLMQFFIIGSMHIKTANHRVLAVNLIQDRIEELKSLGYTGIVTSDYDLPIEEPVVIDIVRPDKLFDDLLGVRTTEVVDITDGKKILVEVNWAEFNRDLSESAETIVYDLR